MLPPSHPAIGLLQSSCDSLRCSNTCSNASWEASKALAGEGSPPRSVKRYKMAPKRCGMCWCHTCWVKYWSVTKPVESLKKRSQLFPYKNRDDDVSDHKILGWVEHSHLKKLLEQWGSDPVKLHMKHPEGCFPHMQPEVCCHHIPGSPTSKKLGCATELSWRYLPCNWWRIPKSQFSSLCASRTDLAISWLDETHVPSLGCPSLSGSADKNGSQSAETMAFPPQKYLRESLSYKDSRIPILGIPHRRPPKAGTPLCFVKVSPGNPTGYMGSLVVRRS